MAKLARSPVLFSARARLIVAFVLAFGFASVQSLLMVPVLVAIGATALLASGMIGHNLARLRGALLLAAAFLLVLPLISGQTEIAGLGPVTLYLEGAQAGALIAGRLLAIVALILALLSPVSPSDLVAGMRALGVPALMADLAFLTLRYMEEISGELARGRLARLLRGGKTGWRALPDHADLLAGSLIRAQLRSEQLWAAMRLRGYSAGLNTPVAPLGPFDWACILGGSVLALAIFWLDRSI